MSALVQAVILAFGNYFKIEHLFIWVILGKATFLLIVKTPKDVNLHS